MNEGWVNGAEHERVQGEEGGEFASEQGYDQGNEYEDVVHEGYQEEVPLQTREQVVAA